MNPFDSIKITIQGQSHSPSISVIADGFPVGEVFDVATVKECLARRRSGKYLFSTSRQEKDAPIFDSGIEFSQNTGKITGAIVAHIDNLNVRPSDYSFSTTPRPSHADYTSLIKDGVATSGGGRFSGRMTAPLVIAGAIAKSLLSVRGIEVAAYISSMAGIDCSAQEPSLEEINACHDNSLPILKNKDAAVAAVKLLAEKGDSAGGVVECRVYGLLAGLGDSLWNGLESKISAALFGIPAVKGVEFGAGFAMANMSGSSANDAFAVKDGVVVTKTNNSGGINGGISNGMPLVVRAAFRPTPSISLPQHTINLETMSDEVITIKGRHDATVVPRATVVVECVICLALLDQLLSENKFSKEGASKC